MRTFAATAAFALVYGVAVAGAQESPAPAPAPADDRDQEQSPERRHIQVLQNPYDISSFYRSKQGSGTMDFGYEEGTYTGRYPIAGFYRSGREARGRYSMFWTTGYGTGRSRGLLGARRPRALGLNGDLCLFAPTFLAPVGPLTGVFFDR